MNGKLISMQAAAELVPSGCMLALGGTTLYRRPMAFVRALVQRRLQTGEPQRFNSAGFHCRSRVRLAGWRRDGQPRAQLLFRPGDLRIGAYVHLFCQPWRVGDHRRN